MKTDSVVCFDLDDTLCVRTRTDKQILESVFGRVNMEPFFTVDEVYTTTVPLPADDDTAAWERLYRTLAAETGVAPDQAESLAEATVAELTTDPKVTFRDGGRAAFEYVSQRYNVVLVTNGSKTVQTAKLDALGIEDAFDLRIYCGPDSEYPRKPDPEPFQRVLEVFDVTADEVTHVGNSYREDITGAHAVGMQSVWVPRDGPSTPADVEPTYQLDSMAALPSVL